MIINVMLRATEYLFINKSLITGLLEAAGSPLSGRPRRACRSSESCEDAVPLGSLSSPGQRASQRPSVPADPTHTPTRVVFISPCQYQLPTAPMNSRSPSCGQKRTNQRPLTHSRDGGEHVSADGRLQTAPARLMVICAALLTNSTATLA